MASALPRGRVATHPASGKASAKAAEVNMRENMDVSTLRRWSARRRGPETHDGRCTGRIDGAVVYLETIIYRDWLALRLQEAVKAGLDRAWLTCNKNGIPYDTRSPFVTSGIRLGTPAGTTRGFGEAEFETIGKLICEVVDGLSGAGPDGDDAVEQSVRDRVAELCDAFPVYPGR